MTHCRREPPPEKTRCVSSQVAGDSTAHTVTIRSMGFIPDILVSSGRQHRGIRNRQREVSRHREEIGFGCPRCREAALSLEINTEHESRLMAFEINEIERRTRSSHTPPSLNAPGSRQPGALRQLEICGRTDKERLAAD